MSYLKIGNVGWSIEDTGFGNRIQFWEIAYELNKYNNFDFEILVESDKWLETKFIDFPNTKSSKELFDKYENIPSIDATKPWLTKLDKNKNYWIEEEWPPYNFGNNFYGTWLHLLKLKDKNLESKIKKLVGQRIGIHVRHWPTIIDDPRKDLIPRFDYESKMEYLKKVLDKYPNDKFFISSDVTYDKPATGPLLPNYRKDSHWLSEIYNDYDVLDYRNIMELDNLLPNEFIETTNIGWIKSFDDEGRTLNVSERPLYFYEDTKSNLESIEKLYEYKILRDVIDLFGLIYSREFISAEHTGPDSSWSDFVYMYREKCQE
tara:strand:- start:527 stop:1480 length:954 start_codon:yes stop_codon:yes gene_type:complete